MSSRRQRYEARQAALRCAVTRTPESEQWKTSLQQLLKSVDYSLGAAQNLRSSAQDKTNQGIIRERVETSLTDALGVLRKLLKEQ